MVLIWLGYLSAEYPAIPSFNISNKLFTYTHTQPSIESYDKGISILLMLWAITMLLKFWENFWIRVSMVFITWGCVGNALDEFKGTSGVFTDGEQVALLMALITTTILILYKRWKIK